MIISNVGKQSGFRPLTSVELAAVSGGSEGEGGNEIIVTGTPAGGGTFMGGGGGGGGDFGGPPPNDTQDAPGDPDADNPPDPNDIGLQVGDAEVTATLNEDGNLEVDVDASPAQFTAGVEFDLSDLSVEKISVGWAGLDFEFTPDFSDANATFTSSQGTGL